MARPGCQAVLYRRHGKETNQFRKSASKATGLTLENLLLSIRGIDQELAAQASRAVNVSLTLRNWLIGCHIAEYELHGQDRAHYGEKLLAKLSARCSEAASVAPKSGNSPLSAVLSNYPQIRRR